MGESSFMDDQDANEGGGDERDQPSMGGCRDVDAAAPITLGPVMGPKAASESSRKRTLRPAPFPPMGGERRNHCHGGRCAGAEADFFSPGDPSQSTPAGLPHPQVERWKPGQIALRQGGLNETRPAIGPPQTRSGVTLLHLKGPTQRIQGHPGGAFNRRGLRRDTGPSSHHQPPATGEEHTVFPGQHQLTRRLDQERTSTEAGPPMGHVRTSSTPDNPPRR